MDLVEVKGSKVPKIGFGTWLMTGRECEEGVRDALEIGYRHVDTAAAYDNEEEVGRAIAASGVPREEIWLTTKVAMDDLEPDRLKRSADASLRKLRTDYVDLLLIHWPNPRVPLEASLGAMVELREAGAIRQLGVSNFPPGLFRQALELAPVFTNQVEYHPFLGQDALLELCQTGDAMLTAYSPLAHGKVIGHPVLEEIGRAHGKTAGQVALRWLIEQPRVAALPKASSHERRAENLDVFDFELSHEERERIDSLPKDQRFSNPSFAPDWDS
jgi:2,5-diketo-D-gluconate reductase B